MRLGLVPRLMTSTSQSQCFCGENQSFFTLTSLLIQICKLNARFNIVRINSNSVKKAFFSGRLLSACEVASPLKEQNGGIWVTSHLAKNLDIFGGEGCLVSLEQFRGNVEDQIRKVLDEVARMVLGRIQP